MDMADARTRKVVVIPTLGVADSPETILLTAGDLVPVRALDMGGFQGTSVIRGLTTLGLIPTEVVPVIPLDIIGILSADHLLGADWLPNVDQFLGTDHLGADLVLTANHRPALLIPLATGHSDQWP